MSNKDIVLLKPKYHELLEQARNFNGTFTKADIEGGVYGHRLDYLVKMGFLTVKSGKGRLVHRHSGTLKDAPNIYMISDAGKQYLEENPL